MSLDNLPVEWSVSQLTKMIASEGLISDGDWIESKDQDEKGDIRLIQLADIGDGDFRDKSNRYMNQDAFDRLNCVELKANDVLIARMPDPLGRACIFPKLPYKCVTVVDVCLIRTGEHSAISPKLLKYWINATQIRNLIALNATGTTRKRITRKKLESFDFPVPPLAEQQEIVRQLDTMLAQVEQIKARLDAIPAILKKFRQSVLADAVSGKLTEEWRNSLQSNKNLDFETYIAEYRIQKYLEWEKESLLRKGKEIPSDEILLKKFKPVLSEEITHEHLPKGWSRQLLDGLIYISARIGWKGLKAEEYTQEGPLFLSVHGLNYGKVVRLDQAFHISQERYVESPEIALKNDDILLCKDGAGIGKVGIVKGLEEPASINSSLLLIRSGEIFVPEFLYYVFKGPYIQKLVQERLTGTAIPHLFQRDIKEFLLDIPPLDEQNLIVEKVEAYFNWVGKIEQTVQSALKRVNLLTQSILAKAFSGELTAEWREQHQDLITGVNSAEALLAKIQAEREASKPVKKTRKKKEA